MTFTKENYLKYKYIIFIRMYILDERKKWLNIGLRFYWN